MSVEEPAVSEQLPVEAIEAAEFTPKNQSEITWTAKRLIAGFVLGAILPVGYAAANSVDKTTGTEAIAGLETTYSFTHQGSELTVLGRSAYADEDYKLGPFRVGLRVEANTLPGNLAKLFSQTPSPAEAKEGYVSALKSGYSKELRTELLWLGMLFGTAGGVTALAGASGKRWAHYTNQRIQHLEQASTEKDKLISKLRSEISDDTEAIKSPEKHETATAQQPIPPISERQRSFNSVKRGVGAIALTMAVSLSAGVAKWEVSTASEARPDQRIPITVVKDLGLADFYAGTQEDADVFNDYYAQYSKFITKEQRQQDAFVAAATTSLTSAENVSAIDVPATSESAILIGSDLHANRAMIRMATSAVKLLNRTYAQAGHTPISLALFAGDNGYRTSWDAAAIKKQGSIGDGAPEATAVGNHDGEKPTFDQLRAGGIKIIDGKVVSLNGIAVVSVADPQETVAMGPTYLRDGQPITPAKALSEEVASGKKIYKLAAKAESKPIGIMHEGGAAQAALGFDAKSYADSKRILTSWFNDKSITSAPISNLPFSLLVYGHWHRIIAPKIVQNSDGTNTLVMELNTMGGARGDNTLGNFNTPIGSIGQTASFPIVFRDNSTGLVTGYQMLVFNTDGRVTIQPRISIDQPLKNIPTLGTPKSDKKQLNVHENDRRETKSIRHSELP